MNVGEIATRVKRQFGDEAGAQITDADIIRWINDAQREIAVNNNLLQVSGTVPTTAGNGEYSLPADLLTLRNVYVDGRKLNGISYEDAVEQDLEESTATGEVQKYWIFANKFNLYPVPGTTGSLRVHYTKRPVDVAVTGDIPEVSQQYHNRIVEYCIAQAYELDDNVESYRSKMQQFQDGMEKLKGHEDWQTQAVYPSITVSANDYWES